MLLLFGLVGFVAAYFVYARLLGSLDGLPALPDKYRPDAAASNVTVRPPNESPTTVKLQEAFGVGSAEADDKVVYKTKVQLPDKGLVIAAGHLEFDPKGSTRVPVSPVSMAIFGKGKLQPGEIPDISTFHADRAVLMFSQNVSKLQDMTNNKAKLVGIELTSSPGIDPLSTSEAGGGEDKRKGYIWITNNQKSADPTEHIVARTTGPVIYQVPDETVPYNPDVANVWTIHPVEVFDRKNLPRTFRFAPPKPDPRRRYAVTDVLNNIPPVAALARPEDLRRSSAIADILNGDVLPPPTISAVGLKIFFAPQDKSAKGATPPSAPGTPPAKKESGGVSGIRQLVFCEKVQMNLWSEGGFPGEGQTGDKPADPDKPQLDPPLALSAVTGGLLDGGAITLRMKKKSLLLIETPGAFRYDFEKEEARFDAATQAPPAGQANFVTVTRLNAIGGQDHLYCSSLTLDLSTPPAPVAVATTAPKTDATNSRNRSIRGLTARGDVYIHVENEGLTAKGTELIYRREASTSKTTTTLRGTPVLAKQESNRMQAGNEATEGFVVIDSLDTPVKKGQPARRTNTVSVRGPGRLELYDAESGKEPQKQGQDTVAARAEWGKSLTHTKDNLGGKEVDLFKFDGGGAFVDPRSDFTLTADVIRLWLAMKDDGKGATTAPKQPGSGAKPERLLADGNVDVRSPELMVKETDKLTVWFRDIAPPKVVPPAAGAVAVAPAPMPTPVVVAKSPVVAGGADPKIAVAPVPAPEAEPAVPIYLSARVVETWVVRYQMPVVPVAVVTPARPAMAAPQPRGGSGKLKYDLERALCEDRVHVQQEATDPSKGLPGMDITGVKLNLDHSTAGSVARVFGTPQQLAAVQYEGLALYGPEIYIDQPNNVVDVTGAGRLKMLSDADLSGNRLDKPSDLVITWTQRMQFWGAKSLAEFVGGVNAQQVVLPTPVAAAKPGAPRPIIKAPGGPAEAVPAPKEMAEPNLNTTRYVLLSHRLDVTFDKPIYFNQLSKKKDKPKPPTTTAVGAQVATAPSTADDRPKLKTAVCTPMPEDETRNLTVLPPTATNVYFFEEVFRPDRTYAQARILTAKQIDFANREKEQDLKATGPGELRILQAGNNDDLAVAAPAPAAPAKPANEDDEMKLTVVTFRKRMNAKDQAKIYQEATFPDGATVIRISATDPRLEVEPHKLPANHVMLASEESLIVSSSKPGKGAKPETRLVANGNAMFKDKKYEGNGGKITYTNQAVVFDGTDKRLATLYLRQSGVNERQYHQAKQIIYRKDGTVSVTGSGGGSLSPGG